MYRSKSRVTPNDYGVHGNLSFFGNVSQTNTAYYINMPESWWLSNHEAWYSQSGAVLSTPVANPGVELIEWNSLGRDQYNDCIHRKSRVVNLPHTMFHERYSAPYTAYLTQYLRVVSPVYPQWTLVSMVHPRVDFQAARARAWHSMQPRFEGEVSLLVSLFELKDFRDIVKYLFLKTNYDKIKRFRRLFNEETVRLSSKRRQKLGKQTGDGFAYDLSGGVAGAWLTYTLAILPTLKDIAGILQQANIIVREAQDKFMNDGQVYQSSHYTEEIHRTSSMYYPPYNNYWCKQGIQQFTKFTATLRYKYDYSMRDTVDAWMKYWGLSGSFEAFWNMLPFSFLTDYVVQIGNSIHAMEHDPNVRLHDWIYGESLKTTFQAGVIFTGDPRVSHLVLDGKYYAKGKGEDHILSGCEGSIYTRRRAEPYYGPATPKWKTPSTRQALNMAALLRCLL